MIKLVVQRYDILNNCRLNRHVYMKWVYINAFPVNETLKRHISSLDNMVIKLYRVRLIKD